MYKALQVSGFEAFSAISAYLCDLRVNCRRKEVFNAEITKIRRDRREESVSVKTTFVQGALNSN